MKGGEPTFAGAIVNGEVAETQVVALKDADETDEEVIDRLNRKFSRRDGATKAPGGSEEDDSE